MDYLVPALSSLVGFIFTISLMRQYWERRKMHQVVWAFGFFLYALAVSLEAYAEAFGWGVFAYRFYCVTFAPLVAFLGCGSVYLLKGRRAGNIFLAYSVVISVVLVCLTFSASINEAVLKESYVGARGMPAYVRLLYPLLTIPGSIALIFGSVWSWYRLWRKTGNMRNEKDFNLWIAIGATVVAASGAFAKLGLTQFLYLGELAGIAMMYYGFVQSRKILTPLR